MSKYETLKLGYIAALIDEDYKLSEIAEKLNIDRNEVVIYFNKICKLRKPIFEKAPYLGSFIFPIVL